MMENKKVGKSKLEPSFSLGLTQSGDSKDSSTRSPRQMSSKMEEGQRDEKKEDKKRLEKVAEAEVKKVPEPTDHRLRHKMSVPKVFNIMQSVHKKKSGQKIVEELKNFGFGGMLHICNWTRIHTFFVDWVVNNFDKDNMCIRLTDRRILKLEVEDVHRVYHLPMVGKKISTNDCSDAAIRSLRKELGMADVSSPFVKVADLEKVLSTTENARVWVKGAICYVIHNILCPTNHSDVSLHYAQILKDSASSSSYNWCSHILDYMKEGLQSPGVANPLADFHFLLINYLEKMGKKSPFLTGQYNHPSLRDWDVKLANQDIQKVYDVMGLEYGLTAGVTQLNATAEAPVVVCFDADTCPLSKTQMYLDYSRKHVEVYTKAMETLKRRISETNAEGETTIRYKLSYKRRKVVHTNVQSEDGGVVNDAKSEDVEEETVKQYPQYFDAGKASNAEFNKNAENVVTQEKEDSVEEETVKQYPQYFEKDESLKKENEIPETSNRGGERFRNDDDVPDQTNDEEYKIDAKVIDDSVKEASNVGATPSPSQEIVLSYPQIRDAAETTNAEFDKNDSDSVNTHSSDDTMNEDTAALYVTPLKVVLADVQTCSTEQNKKHGMLYSGHTQPQRRRAVKKSKYFQSPYDKPVLESNASKLQKDIATFAWSSSHDKEDIMYNSNNRSHCFVLQRFHLRTLKKDEWVSSFVVNSWVNCLNWNQANDKRRRLITPLVNYHVFNQQSESDAFDKFVKRLSAFKYINYKDIDPTALEYIMAPALAGNPGYHYVCFVLNIKTQKFEFLNSLNGVGEKLQTEDKQPTVYKNMFDIWLNEAQAFVEGLYAYKKIQMPFKFSQFKWDIPTVPSQPDSNSCGVFCMKFLDEWNGNSDTLKSFKGWSSIGKRAKDGKLERVMDFRIQICSSILSNTSNSKKAYVEKEANSYYEETLRKLEDPTT